MFLDYSIVMKYFFNYRPQVPFFNVTLPSGEYVVSMFQDKNGNGKLDTYLFNIPKEPIGLTNYFKKGIPGPYKKL